MGRLLKYLLGLVNLNRHTVLHDNDSIGHGTHHFQVMADEQVGQPIAGLQVPEQIDQLHLHRSIQCTGWLIQQNHLGLEDQRTRHRNTLTLPPGEFVRKTVPGISGQANLFEHSLHTLISTRFVSFQIMRAKPFCNRVTHGTPWRQTTKRILKDHLQITTQRLHRSRIQFRDVAAIESNLAGRRHQAQQRLSERALAGTGLTNNTECLTGAQLQINTVYRLDVINRAP